MRFVSNRADQAQRDVAEVRSRSAKNEIPVTLLEAFLDLPATLRLCNGAVKALAELCAQRIVATSAMDSGERLS
jgi:hypothetical protein